MYTHNVYTRLLPETVLKKSFQICDCLHWIDANRDQNHWSTRFQIFASASYLLSDLFSPDDVHALPAINTTEQEQGTEDEESYEADFLDISFGDDEEDDTAVASKVLVAHYVETRVLISTVKKLT